MEEMNAICSESNYLMSSEKGLEMDKCLRTLIANCPGFSRETFENGVI